MRETSLRVWAWTLSPELSPWQGPPCLLSRAGFYFSFLSRYGYGQNFLLSSAENLSKRNVQVLGLFTVHKTIKSLQAFNIFIVKTMHTHRQLKPRKNVCGDYNEYILKCTILMAAFKISTLIQRSRGSFPGHPQVPQLRLSDSLWVIPSAVSSVTDCPESQGRGSLMGSHRVEQQQQPSRDRVRTRITS